MKKLIEAVRGILLSLTLDAGDIIYKITGGKRPSGLFIKRVPHKKINTSVKIISETEDSTDIAKFNSDGSISDDDFKIMIATDMHVGDDRAAAEKTFSMLYKNAEKLKPDLILFTGDIILTKFQQLDSLQFAKFMEDLGIYWAVIFGNHEASEEKGLFKHFLIKNLSAYPHCLTKYGPEKLFGYGNFFINILGSDKKIYKNLVFFDSGRNIRDEYRKEYNIPDNMNSYDFIKENQIVWFEENIKKLKKTDEKVKSLLFMHIPLPEYKEVMTLDKSGKIPAGRKTGKAEILSGNIHESVSCSDFNSGLFDRALKQGAQGFFAGHDHMNDFTAVYKGAYLVYNQFSGYDEYSFGKTYNLPEKDWLQGVTELILHKDGKITINRHLNSAFGCTE